MKGCENQKKMLRRKKLKFKGSLQCSFTRPENTCDYKIGVQCVLEGKDKDQATRQGILTEREDSVKLTDLLIKVTCFCNKVK